MEENILKWWIANKNVLRDILINGFVEKKHKNTHRKQDSHFFLIWLLLSNHKIKITKAISIQYHECFDCIEFNHDFD